MTLAALLVFVTGLGALAQDQDQDQGKKIVITPDKVELEVDQQMQLQAKVVDATGNATQDSVIFFSRARRSVSVTPDGMVKALKPGSYQLIALTLGPRESRITQTIDVKVAYPPIAEINLFDMPDKLYTATTVPVNYEVIDAKGLKRENADVTISSSNPSIASVDKFGAIKAHKAGNFTLTLKAGNASTSWQGRVERNPVSTIELNASSTEVRTGDVVQFTATPKTASGQSVDDAPVTYSFTSKTDNDRGEGASGQIEQDGRFVANMTGLFTIMAKSGNTVAEETIQVNERNVQKNIQVVGHGLISDVHTSDLWVWEGFDGKDYAVTGTWGANGEAYFWDVTDPSNMQIIDTVTVDARTVNDVKVSEDGRIAVITREGASDRKNGIVILDVTDPHNVSIISEYTDGLTGGVHNAFIYEDHVYAVNNGRRYDIIDISDPKNPRTVSRFELDTPGHAIHDVWIEDGIAYSSNWSDGVVAVDVGSQEGEFGTAGGSPENPKMLGKYTYPSGWNHAAFPFKSQSTGNFYVVAGDEAFPSGINVDNKPTVPAGWIHFFKLNSWEESEEVASYKVPEAGTHNLWIKGDTLYVAYYNAGLRIVDISGELMGNLYDQGREIAKFIPTHHEGRVPNAPMSWGPQPYKGYIFVSDWNSGLWAFKLVDQPQGTN